MNSSRKSCLRDSRANAFGCVGLLLLAGFSAKVCAEDALNLPVVKPVVTCSQLAKADLSKDVGAAVTIQSAVVADTPKGQFCRVTGDIEPSTIFEVDLPIEHWTGRLIGNPSNARAIANAVSCAPALNGEFAVAYNNQGYSSDGMTDPSWTSNMQLRIDFAYRANHVTTLAAKALIKAFYGQPQRFSYFIGCSEGGRQALTEAQRFPEDYDGVVAGSPLILDSARNPFTGPWERFVNRRADGSKILLKERLGILHQAVIEHCAAKSGVLDGVLLEPTACKFDPAWVQCPAGAADTSKCLTAEETRVAEKLYEGPGDSAGHHFDIAGSALGTELHWWFSTTPVVGNRVSNVGFQLRHLLPPPESNKSATELEEEFTFSQEWFDKLSVLAPLFNAGNTNLRPFAERGGKLILWNGAEDPVIQPAVSIAYYEGVQKEIGTQPTDKFMRFFLIPGFGHCEGGDIPFQFDLLTPLMAWTELNRAPAKVVAGKAADGLTGQYAAPGGPWVARNPLAMPGQIPLFTRPVYPYPYIARYSGKGDPNDEANYEPVRSGVVVPSVFNTEATKLIGPNNQKFYHVENGLLVPDVK